MSYFDFRMYAKLIWDYVEAQAELEQAARTNY
jgi:hypothetical protein